MTIMVNTTKSPAKESVHGREVTAFSASSAKNTFGMVMDSALAYGMVAITKHDHVRAIVLSLEEYERMLDRQPDPLRTLRGEFEGLVARMQTPKSRSAAKSLFAAGPEALGAAAVKQARKRG